MGKLVHWAFAVVLLAAVSPAVGHFNVILPESYAVWSATKGDSVPYRFIWGHGYEHIWFDATKPAALFAISPSGSKVDLLPQLKETTVLAEDKAEHRAYSFDLDAAQRGDYIIGIKAALIWDKE